jgi:hypothetical protein
MNAEGLRYEDVTKLLRERYAPPQWAYIEQVGDATGSYTSRHADGLAMGLWPSRGLELLGFEVKVSRSDWRRELVRPSKAEPIARRCDRWFVVAPADIVPLIEVPSNWGLIEVRKGKLIQTKEAAKLDPEPLDRSFLAAILRKASTQNPTEQMRLEARREARLEMEKELPSQVEFKTYRIQGELDALRRRVEAFEATTGIPLEDHQGTGYYGFPSGEDLARAVLFLAGDGIRKIKRQIETIDRVIEHLQGATNVAKELIEEPEEL